MFQLCHYCRVGGPPKLYHTRDPERVYKFNNPQHNDSPDDLHARALQFTATLNYT